MNLPLSPSWVANVPAPFTSTAVSIERFRHQLVGEPDALRAIAGVWRREADQLDASWRFLDASRQGFLSSWRGDAARQYDLRADRLSGRTAWLATSLRFAADGLELAAGELVRARRAAEVAVVRYVVEVRRLWDSTMMLAPQFRGAAWPAMAATAASAAGEALNRIHAEQTRLDHVLASMWNRFDLTRSAPWRRGITRTPQRMSVSDVGVAGDVTKRAKVKVLDGQFAGRLAVKPGVVLFRDIHGTYTVQIGVDVRGTGTARAGRKVDVSLLPPALLKEAARGYAEAEAGGRVASVARYHFNDQAQARAFADKIRGLDPSGLRPPDETALTWGGIGKAAVDGGLPTMAGAAANTNADVYWSYTNKKDGSSAWTYGKVTESKAGVTGNGETDLLAGGSGSQVRLDYNPAGAPVQYTSRTVEISDYASNSGTTNKAPVGASASGVGELYYKSYDETARRTVETRVLDLRPPANAQSYGASLAGDASASARFANHVSNNGTITVQQYDVHSRSDAVSVKVDTPVPWLPAGGLMGSKMVEDHVLVDSWYVNNTRPGGRLYEAVPGRRPLP